MLKARYPIIAACIFAVWHITCHVFNLYFEIWWSDIVAHFIAGATAALILWWIIDNRSGVDRSASPKIVSLSLLSFATFISVLWEFWEYSNWRFAFLRNTIGRIQLQYYPFLGNNLGDILWGLLGGFTVAIIALFVRRK